MPKPHTVVQGDCVDSIALRAGMATARIWDFPANSDLKARRLNLNVLLPGDVLTIPDNESELHEAKETRRRHTFQLARRTRDLRITALLGGIEPSALAYEVKVDGNPVPHRLEGKTIVCTIPLDARIAVVKIIDGGEYEIELGHLDPLATPPGEERRLLDLGYMRHLPKSWAANRENARKQFDQTYALEGDEALAQLGRLVGDPLA